jgi:hypothetical protein
MIGCSAHEFPLPPIYIELLIHSNEKYGWHVTANGNFPNGDYLYQILEALDPFYKIAPTYPNAAVDFSFTGAPADVFIPRCSIESPGPMSGGELLGRTG